MIINVVNVGNIIKSLAFAHYIYVYNKIENLPIYDGIRNLKVYCKNT